MARAGLALGAILQWNDNRALVRARVAEKKVEIRVGGAAHTRREMLALLRAHVDVIHRTFTESAGRQNFPIQAFIYPSAYPGLELNYYDLLTFERDGVPEIPATYQNRAIRLNVREVLNGFSTPDARREERKRMFPEEERMPREIHYHEHKHLEAGDISGSVVNLGNENWIAHSFTTLANPALAALLAQLTQAVQAMLERLPAEQAAEARDDLQRLQEELQKSAPSRKWYSVSIEGLKQAAQNVGEIGLPVI